eukprot:Gb_40918 [translate_table: standard]
MARSMVPSSSVSLKVLAASRPLSDAYCFPKPKQNRGSHEHILKKNTIQAHFGSKNTHRLPPETHFQHKISRSKPLKFGRQNSGALHCRAGQLYNVEIEHEGKKHMVQVPEDETILSKALDAGMNVPHDCKLGVCMTCPAKLVSGEVDQSEGMLSDDVVEKGYALMCASYPRSDCSIRTIPEDELLSLQLVTAST